MAKITYTAKRNISQYHAEGVEYTFSVPLESCTPSKKYNRIRHKSISGQTETWLKSIQKQYSIVTTGLSETEAPRTNMLLYSEDFTQSAWQKTNLTVTANSGIAPDGANTATFLNEGAVTSSHYLVTATAIPGSANMLYTYSTYLKASTRSAARLLIQDTATGGYFQAGFDLTTGAISIQANAINGFIVSAAAIPDGDGWFKCSITGYFTSTPTLKTWTYTLQTYTGGSNYLGVVGQGILVFGKQLEASEKMTPYIATADTAMTEIPLLSYMQEFMDSVADGSTFQITFDAELGETSPTSYELESDSYDEAREGVYYRKVMFSVEEI